MSKILKAPSIIIDNENKINIDVPTFSKDINLDFDYSLEENESLDEDNYIDEKDSIDEEIILANAKNKADNIIKEAELEAEKIIEEAKIEAENIKMETFEESKKNGYNIGLEEAYAEVEGMKNATENEYNEALKQREIIIDSIEEDMVNLMEKILNKILGDSVNINPKVILSLIKQGLSKNTVSGDVFIHISKDDYDCALEEKETIISFTDGNTNIELIKDFSLNKGDCIIETPFGNIDCSLDQQFQNLKDNLYYILENG